MMPNTINTPCPVVLCERIAPFVGAGDTSLARTSPGPTASREKSAFAATRWVAATAAIKLRWRLRRGLMGFCGLRFAGSHRRSVAIAQLWGLSLRAVRFWIWWRAPKPEIFYRRSYGKMIETLPTAISQSQRVVHHV